jgi:hypothetical protein
VSEGNGLGWLSFVLLRNQLKQILECLSQFKMLDIGLKCILECLSQFKMFEVALNQIYFWNPPGYQNLNDNKSPNVLI